MTAYGARDRRFSSTRRSRPTSGVFLQESFAPAYPDCGAHWIGEDTPLAPARYTTSILDAECSTERFY